MRGFHQRKESLFITAVSLGGSFEFCLVIPFWNTIAPNHFSNISHQAVWPWRDSPAVWRRLAAILPGAATSLSYFKAAVRKVCLDGCPENQIGIMLFFSLNHISAWPLKLGWVVGGENIKSKFLITCRDT